MHNLTLEALRAVRRALTHSRQSRLPAAYHLTTTAVDNNSGFTR